MKLVKDIHGPGKIKPNYLGDALVFHLAQPSGQNVNWAQYFGIWPNKCKNYKKYFVFDAN